MNREEVLDRADITEEPVELMPNKSDDAPRWIADDPETGCRGVGDFEEEARANLVHAVRAYNEDREDEIEYFSAGRDKTYKMTWLYHESLVDRVLAKLGL